MEEQSSKIDLVLEASKTRGDHTQRVLQLEGIITKLRETTWELGHVDFAKKFVENTPGYKLFLSFFGFYGNTALAFEAAENIFLRYKEDIRKITEPKFDSS